MSKITPQDYINAKPELVRAGYLAIKAKAKNTKVADIAKLYGVSTDVVDLVKLSGNVDEFETIVRLEVERQMHDAEKEAEASRNLYKPELEPKKKVHPAYYVVSVVILIGILVGIGWLVWSIGKFIGGLV